jgi:hypothetical protein
MNSASTQWNATGIAPFRQNSAPLSMTFTPSRTAITTKYRPAKMRSAPAVRGFARANAPVRMRRFHATTLMSMRMAICAGSSRY